ncbi:beta-lactamase [Bacillus cereus VD133]|uniref:Beta-lactamase n=1 Tax=Bacillus cereus VD133 TaxID=1053233 RepID=A0A9W5PL70_BACCE|nr:class A beta-lactamase [Bacillus cereus]EOO27147.1 beta-lactamase [Bacillus cereus VD133]
MGLLKMNFSNKYKVLGTAVVLGQLVGGPIISHADTFVPNKQIQKQDFNKVTQTSQETAIHDAFSQLEKKFDARLGVFAIDTGTNQTITYNADKRFAYASTHKALAVGALLQKKSLRDLDQVIPYTQDDLVNYNPITKDHVNTGMTLKDLCDASIRYSDNTANNLILKQIGGPKGMEQALRGIGDTVTNSERFEPELNVVNLEKGEIQDTSTPRAIATSLQAFTLGNALPKEKRTILINFLKGNTVGDTLIRAGVPKGWEVADKTGAGSYGTRNDIAVIWPPNGKPIVLAIMSDRNTKDATYNDKLIAQATKEIMDTLKGNHKKTNSFPI